MRTGTANLASVLAGLRRTGAAARTSASPEVLASAGRVVLPGVGAFAAAMDELERSGLDQALRERIEAGRPTLAICLGLQLLGLGSEESPAAAGLGFVPVVARRFPAGVRTPQLGWNEVRPAVGMRGVPGGAYYFANTYRIEEAPPGWSAAHADHGGEFVAAFERGDVLACQFHPELSGALGARLLGAWVAGGVAC